ncbi:hypothetical protein MUK42_33788 [Musa troglodytarum]|uniref:Uncharacterized protein n=1 Tax=Musa troglodytarum TaxID=320322 RepID=A0A9E7H8P2_9LILI|nr:hypothetical protein MUK42_33788 [Musa troglodytarum]
MIWVMGMQRRFDLACFLVRGMHPESVLTQQAVVIVMERYSVSRLLGYYDCQKEYDCCADIFKEASRLTIQVSVTKKTMQISYWQAAADVINLLSPTMNPVQLGLTARLHATFLLVQECRGWRSLRMELHAVDSTFFEGEIAFLVSIFR